MQHEESYWQHSVRVLGLIIRTSLERLSSVVGKSLAWDGTPARHIPRVMDRIGRSTRKLERWLKPDQTPVELPSLLYAGLPVENLESVDLVWPACSQLPKQEFDDSSTLTLSETLSQRLSEIGMNTLSRPFSIELEKDSARLLCQSILFMLARYDDEIDDLIDRHDVLVAQIDDTPDTKVNLVHDITSFVLANLSTKCAIEHHHGFLSYAQMNDDTISHLKVLNIMLTLSIGLMNSDTLIIPN